MLERLIVAALATWRLSSLMLYEAGPLDVFMRLRSVASRSLFTAELFSCVYCLSVWIAVLVALLMLTDLWLLLIPFALSATAVMVDRCLKPA